MSRLVLAEKPSVGRDFARALGCTKKSDGYFEGPSTIVTWTIGHLLEAAPPEYYGPELKKWNFDNLPILPNQFGIFDTTPRKGPFQRFYSIEYR